MSSRRFTVRFTKVTINTATLFYLTLRSTASSVSIQVVEGDAAVSMMVSLSIHGSRGKIKVVEMGGLHQPATVSKSTCVLEYSEYIHMYLLGVIKHSGVHTSCTIPYTYLAYLSNINYSGNNIRISMSCTCIQLYSFSTPVHNSVDNSI
jgi:hypothetical protein